MAEDVKQEETLLDVMQGVRFGIYVCAVLLGLTVAMMIVLIAATIISGGLSAVSP
jgi:hypothetical protein